MSKLPKYAHWGMFCLLLLQACSSHQDQSQLLKLLSPGKTGVEFKNILRESDLFNVLEYGYFYNGGGLAAGDLNQDGLPELYFSGNMVANRLYLNKGGLKFEDVTQAAGLEAAGLWNTGVTMADVNGDGWLDIYICRSAAADPDKRRNLLFINNGADSFNQQQVPTFSEQAAAYGIDDPAYSTQAAFFDYDRDGDLDLYLLNHSVQEYAGFSKTLGQFKHRLNPFYGDKLYRNDGNHFTDVTRQAGIISNVLGFGLGVAISDVNQDHWPDIYVSNDYNEQDYLYINQRDGTFRESLAQHINHVSLFSMGSDVADINNDALPDIYTLDMLPEDAYRQKMTSGPDHFEKNQVLKNQGFYHQSMRNMLQLNNGDGTFSEIGQLAGISNTDWSWAALFCDLDNDGFKDLFVSNGYKRDYTNMDFMAFAVDEQLKSQKSGKEVAVQRLLEHMPAIEVPNYVFRNQGQLQFKKMNDSWGMNEVLLSNGAVYADLDRDGDLELITNNINAPASIYQNLSRERHAPHFLQLQLSAAGKNTHAIGAKVYLHTAEGVQFQELMPTRGFQSSVEPILHFGLGNDSLPKALTIIWPDGSQQQVQGLAVDQRHLISQQATDPAPLPKHQPPLFTRLQEGSPTFVHRENLYVDFKREPLLPQMISTQGPKMAKADVNGDGREDVWIGGAKGQSGQLFLQRSSGFAAVPQPAFDADQESEDLGAAFFDADQDGDPDLYVVSGGNEGNAQDPSLQDRLYLNDGRGNFRKAPKALPSMATSGSCVRPADIDRDGDTDLFVGGRLVPGQYPLPPTSYLLINDGSGRFTDQTAQLAPELQQAGMVCDAAWLDVNADGFEELLVVGEWMPVTLFNNHQGQLREPLALPHSAGWWNTLHTADMDQDGDLDLVLGNHGLNAQFRASPEQPVEMYAKDFDQNGFIDPIMTYYIGGVSYPMASRDELLGQVNSLKKQFTSYDAFARARLTDMFPPETLQHALLLKAEMLESVYVENKGNGQFEIHPLPVQAQFAPVYAIRSLDANADGHPDLLLAGNMTATRVKFGEYDANYGQLFLGDGKGHFHYLPQYRSGLRIRGDVRDLQLLNVQGVQQLWVSRSNDSLLVYRLQLPPGS